MPTTDRGIRRPRVPARVHRAVYIARCYSWLVDPRRFRSLPPYPIDRPIFLLGTQGGGLTLLSRMLRRLPEVISAAGNHRYWTASDEIQNVYGPMLPFALTGIRHKAPRHPRFPAPRSWTYAARDLYGLYRKTEVDASPELEHLLKRVIRLSAERHAEDPWHFRFLDKSQVYTLRVSLLHSLLLGCDPKFVFVSRDPYVAVYRAATGQMWRLEPTVGLEERIDIAAEHYANSARAAFEDCERLGVKMYVMRFEDLLTNTQTELSAVCDFLGLTYGDNLLPNPDQRFPIGTCHLDRWYPLRADVNTKHVSIDHQPRVRRAVDTHFGPLIERLGYAPAP